MTLAILVSPPGEEIDHHLNPTASSTREKGHLIFTTYALSHLHDEDVYPPTEAAGKDGPYAS